MKKQRNSSRIWRYFNPEGTRKYLSQITLILISLFIATSVDRCRESAKNKEKLREYLSAIQVDLKEESATCERNLNDCKNDISSLIQTLQLATNPHPDSIRLALTAFSGVYWRGVFRAFPPTTFEMMREAGDARLLKDLALRNQLSAVFAFRSSVIKQDLEQYDQQTEICAEKLGQFIDLAELLYSNNGVESSIKDRVGFLKSPHNEVFLLLRKANLRAFHLENALEDLKQAEADLVKYFNTLQ